MPKLTFYNLSEDKKQTLIASAKKEFSRAPLSEASISNIIKSAGISRGSFYQYFEDKEDVFFYLLNEQTKQRKSDFILSLAKNNGDLFDSMITLFTSVLQNEDDSNFLKNAFLNMTHKIENSFAGMINDSDRTENFKKMTALINKDKLNAENDKELYHLLQIVIAVTFHSIVEKFSRDLSFEEALNNYQMEIHLLKKGLCRNE
ncbi:TetR/AcrR family transcriptional regulator [Jeotgalibacillus sp. S-D1]|uniref:TetR/AcrR family transcriptional regulator n=1 Tax=Jeotgalibacillus sp. S-D1 TaxID=2552189 RepID=UPI001059A6D3|nr:TetR family transcriptional regulator [Jeotgalibacillus sp. S-D1]TDL31871.1 TetR/AcrR family transcriptional regulator [Jeotgalibacillus sp. S-D1]